MLTFEQYILDLQRQKSTVQAFKVQRKDPKTGVVTWEPITPWILFHLYSQWIREQIDIRARTGYPPLLLSPPIDEFVENLIQCLIIHQYFLDHQALLTGIANNPNDNTAIPPLSSAAKANAERMGSAFKETVKKWLTDVNSGMYQYMSSLIQADLKSRRNQRAVFKVCALILFAGSIAGMVGFELFHLVRTPYWPSFFVAFTLGLYFAFNQPEVRPKLRKGQTTVVDYTAQKLTDTRDWLVTYDILSSTFQLKQNAVKVYRSSMFYPTDQGAITVTEHSSYAYFQTQVAALMPTHMNTADTPANKATRKTLQYLSEHLIKRSTQSFYSDITQYNNMMDEQRIPVPKANLLK